MKKYADSQTDSLLDVMAQNGIKLPRPGAIIKHCQKTGLSRSETLFGEINDLFNSLNFYQQQKYFTSRYSDIDDIANVLRSEHNFPYEGSADFLSDFADNIWGRKETRFSVMPISKYDQYRKELHRVAKLGRFDMEKSIIRVGSCPSVLRLIGFENRPLMLSGSVVWKSMYNTEKARYISEETLGKIGEAIEDPLFIEQSATMPENGIVVHTELEHDGEKLAVAIHLSKEKQGYIIHNIASVYSRSQSQKDRVLAEGRLLYLNTERGFSEFSTGQELQSPRRENLKNLFVGGKVLTQDDLNQVKNSENPHFSFIDTRNAEELEALDRKFRELYERYKGGDQAAYEEAVRLVRSRIIKSKFFRNKIEDTERYSELLDKFRESEIEFPPQDFDEWLEENGYDVEENEDNYELEEEYRSEMEDLADKAVDRYVESGEIFEEWAETELNDEEDFYRLGAIVPYVWSEEWAYGNRSEEAKSQKQAVIDLLISLSENNGWNYGVGIDEFAAGPYDHVLYFDTPAGQISFHMDREGVEDRGLENKKYGGSWDGVKGVQGKRLKEFFEKYSTNEQLKSLPSDFKIYEFDSKLLLPFTFDNNGELIPLSERFDDSNPDMRWSFIDVQKPDITGKNISARFSAIDSDLEARKRKAAVLLAEKLYNQAGQNYNPENGNSEAFNPTEEQLQDVYMSEMDFLDEDVDEIVNQAMAIAYKMASRGGNIKNIREGQRKDSGLGKRKTLSNALSERVS